jgi:hypothetical protein
VHEDISTRQQIEEDGMVRSPCQVEGDALLVRVQIEEQPARLRVALHAGWERATLAGEVAPGWLDLDDLRPEVGHQLGRIRGGDHAAVLDHP